LENLKSELLSEKNKKKEIHRRQFIIDKLKEWRNKSWKELLGGILLYVLLIIFAFYHSNWNLQKTLTFIDKATANIVVSAILSIVWGVFTIFVLKSLYDKYRNHSNIEHFKKGLDIPEHLKSL